jgi:membrane protein
MFSPKELWPLTKESVNAWLDDRAASMGAVLAYYSAFLIAPSLIVTIAAAGLVFGRDAAQEAVVTQLQGLLGDAGGKAITEILRSTADFGSSILAVAIAVSALVVTATTAFVELQDDLDRIWKAEPRAGSGIANLIRSRVLSFGMAGDAPACSTQGVRSLVQRRKGEADGAVSAAGLIAGFMAAHIFAVTIRS